MFKLSILAMDKCDDKCALVKVTSNDQMRSEARKDLRYAISYHQQEKVELLLHKSGKCCAGHLLRNDNGTYDSEVFQDLFNETTPGIRDLVIEFAFQEDLKVFFQKTLSRFHKIKENNKSNPGCYIVCRWLDLVLCYLNKKNSLIYPLSDNDRSLLGL